LQHIVYPYQVRCKADFLAETLIRSGAVSRQTLDSSPIEILAAPDCFAYRQRIRLFVGGRGEVGFRRQASHQVVGVDSCMIARPTVDRALRAINELELARAINGFAEQILIEESPADELIVMTILSQRPPRPREIEWIRGVAGESGITEILIEGRDFSRISLSSTPRPLLNISLPTSRGMFALFVEPGGFCQVNQAQNLNLVELVCSWTGRGKRVLDLFCGAGNFSIPLAAGNRVTGCDLQRAAIRAADFNGDKNRVEVDFFRSSAAQGLARLTGKGERFDLVILDPPRSGCQELLDDLTLTGAEEIIYISCDPATLARDLAILKERGYRFEKIAAVDMFPQTRHLETVVSLVRN